MTAAWVGVGLFLWGCAAVGTGIVIGLAIRKADRPQPVQSKPCTCGACFSFAAPPVPQSELPSWIPAELMTDAEVRAVTDVMERREGWVL